MPNLADKYLPSRDLKVKELDLTFEITSQGTPYIRKNGGLQKVGSLLTKRALYIDYAGHTITVGYWNKDKNNFDYKIEGTQDELGS